MVFPKALGKFKDFHGKGLISSLDEQGRKQWGPNSRELPDCSTQINHHFKLKEKTSKSNIIN